jgi:hypothetical protein
MHILLSLLGAVVTVLILLHRLADAGISLGGLNPFLQSRRRHWERKFTGNPIYQIESPMDATALLLTAAAKIDGDMSSEQKSQILSAFEDEFKLNKKESAGLLISSNYLLGRGDGVTEQLDAILKPSLPNFTQTQAESAAKLLQQLSERDMQPNADRQAFIQKATQLILEPFQPKDGWE